jgi:hypothetical protein
MGDFSRNIANRDLCMGLWTRQVEADQASLDA